MKQLNFLSILFAPIFLLATLPILPHLLKAVWQTNSLLTFGLGIGLGVALLMFCTFNLSNPYTAYELGSSMLFKVPTWLAICVLCLAAFVGVNNVMFKISLIAAAVVGGLLSHYSLSHALKLFRFKVMMLNVVIVLIVLGVLAGSSPKVLLFNVVNKSISMWKTMMLFLN